jgi:hypothetical protein
MEIVELTCTATRLEFANATRIVRSTAIAQVNFIASTVYATEMMSVCRTRIVRQTSIVEMLASASKTLHV